MKIEARIERYVASHGPDPWEEDWGVCLPLDHVICRDIDGTPHTVGEFIWPWSAYTSHQEKLSLQFFYWKKLRGTAPIDTGDITPAREARMRELQFLMTRQIYFGSEMAPTTLYSRLAILRAVACFAEAQSCSVRDVLTQTALLDACGASLTDYAVEGWISWLKFLGQLDPQTQLGFSIAPAKRWKDLSLRIKEYGANCRQHAPLPTRIYGALINNLSAELDDIEAHRPRLLAALREAISEYRLSQAARTGRDITICTALIEKHDLVAYFERRGYANVTYSLRALTGTVSEIFQVCKLQIHLFSGMRDSEARYLPYHCMVSEMGLHGRRHCLIAGATTKFNKGRRLRTKWVTTEHDGFRAIRLAQDFAAVIYDARGVSPNNADDFKDDYPLLPANVYLPWMRRNGGPEGITVPTGKGIPYFGDSLRSRLFPIIEDEDVAELEAIDPFRAWREEPQFAIGQRWPLTTHQLRRSLAVYANASGLVRLSSLRRQLQHITREMAMYYGRGSTFCKNFIADDPAGYKKHVAVDWQSGAEEAEMLAFVRDVLNSNEPMFGGAGAYYERQRERGEVMLREEVAKQMKAGLLAYRDGPLGGCTRPGRCEVRKGLNFVDSVCATEHCKHLIGKHSKIVQTIRLKRAAMAHAAPGSITEAMELEELEALERVEREWRPEGSRPAAISTGDGHA